MSQTWHSNGSDSHENRQDEYPLASPCGVLEHVYPLVDPAMLAHENNDVVARGEHILFCGPYDDEGDDK